MSTVTVTVVDHPLVVDALARIRDRTTPNALFRQNLERIGTLLMARATETLPTIDTTVDDAADRRRRPSGCSVQPVVVPILRAGLGFVHAAQELLPGRRRRVHRHQPRRGDVRPEAVRQQAARVARRTAGDRRRPDAGDRRLARPHRRAAGGARRARRRSPSSARCARPRASTGSKRAGLSLHVVTAAIDDHLNDSAFIVPGLGDAGDRQFGPPASDPGRDQTGVSSAARASRYGPGRRRWPRRTA